MNLTIPTPQTQAFPTHTAERPCPECDGEGRYEVQDPGPYSRFAIEPRWNDVACEDCNGTGLVWVERCDRCGLTEIDSGEHAWDACGCSEDTLAAWQASGAGPEVSEAAANVMQYLLDHHIDGGTIHGQYQRCDARWARRVHWAAEELREHATGPAEAALARTLDALAANLSSEVAA